jgi:hypothetical protein
MDQSSGLEDDAIQECDETLLLKGFFLILKSIYCFFLLLLDINNQINGRNSVRQH